MFVFGVNFFLFVFGFFWSEFLMALKAKGISIGASSLHPHFLPVPSYLHLNVIVSFWESDGKEEGLDAWRGCFKAMMPPRTGCKMWIVSPSLSPPIALLRLSQHISSVPRCCVFFCFVFSHFNISEMRTLQSVGCHILVGSIFFLCLWYLK